jgi:hypothetical protein
VIDEDRLDTLEDFGSLDGMRAGADFKIDVRRGNAHLAEEDVGEGFVVMLAGVDKDRLDLRMSLHLAHERRDFGEIGTGAYDVDDFQLAGHEFFKGVRESQYSIRVQAVQGARTTVRAKKALVRCKAFDSLLEPA